MIRWRCLLLVLAVAPAPVAGAQAATGAAFTPDFFGMHFHRVKAVEQLPAKVGSWRLWDVRSTWADIETAPGVYDFRRLDELVAIARQRDIDLLLPLAMTPAWASRRPHEASGYGPGRAAPPRDLKDWQRFVATVVRRYKGRIAAYEIWNEPNLPMFFSGTPAELALLQQAAFEVIRREDPAALVVSSAVTGSSTRSIAWLNRFAEHGGLQAADVVGYHFYMPKTGPEGIQDTLRQVQAVMQRAGVSLPIWNTEAGWRIRRDAATDAAGAGVGADWPLLDDVQVAAYMMRVYLLARSQGVERYYWYSWDHLSMGLVGADAQPNAAGRAYLSLEERLTGLRVGRCMALPDGSTWRCALAGQDGQPYGVAVWSTTPGSWSYPAPAGQVPALADLWKLPFVQCRVTASAYSCDGPALIAGGSGS